jgi:hypothetical protein
MHMQDWIISPRRQKKELLAWILCLLIAVILNIIGISKYNTSWNELYSQLHLVIFLSLVLYVLLGIIRLIIYGVVRVLKR